MSNPSILRSSHELSGTWRFAFVPDDGDGQRGEIEIPGSWEEQGYGTQPETAQLTTWTKSREAIGVGRYTRSLDVPSDWRSRSIFLELAGVRWRSRVFVDGEPIGENDSLSVEHRYDLTASLAPGETHELTLEVDNRPHVPIEEAHIHSDQTATRWGGITGHARLSILPRDHIVRSRVRADVENSAFSIEANVHITQVGSDLYVLKARVRAQNGTSHEASTTDLTKGRASLRVALGSNARPWSDVDPHLYDVELTLSNGEETVDIDEFRTGLREFTCDADEFSLNGQPVFLRGYVDCCIFPLTGYPSWDVEEYRRQFRIAKAHGFNHVRLHSWTPPAPFWEAADELGMLVQTELPNWTAYYSTRERPAPKDVHAFFVREFERIVDRLGNHPSWVMFSNGNELIYGPDGHPELNDLVRMGRLLDPTRLYTDNTGFGQLPAPHREADFLIHSCNWHPPQRLYDAATPDAREDFGSVTSMSDRPVVGHEHGQFTMYVRLEEQEKYTGVLSPTWLGPIMNGLRAKGLEDRVGQFVEASGAHLVHSYKETIERARRTPGLAGFQLLDIRDFPGQGHATTGVRDVFWDDKGLITPEEFSRFNGPRCLLMRASSRTGIAGRPLSVEIEVSNYDTAPLPDRLAWRVVDESGETVASGTESVADSNGEGLFTLAKLSMPTPGGSAQELRLHAELGETKNDWSFWVFPQANLEGRGADISSSVPALRHILPSAYFGDDHTGNFLRLEPDQRVPPGEWRLAISRHLTVRVLDYLHDGGSVWLMPGANDAYGSVPTRFLPPFWSYLLFPDNTSSVMGTILHSHPSLTGFPHEGVSDWHLFHLFDGASAICLDTVPTIQPIVEVIDNPSRAKRLAYSFEARVGKGRLFVTTFPFSDRWVGSLPEARHMFRRNLEYVLSNAFSPKGRLTVAELLGLFRLTTGRGLDFES